MIKDIVIGVSENYLEHLLVMSKQHGIKPAWPSACAILQDTTPLPDGRSSPCVQQLANFPCPPAP